MALTLVDLYDPELKWEMMQKDVVMALLKSMGITIEASWGEFGRQIEYRGLDVDQRKMIMDIALHQDFGVTSEGPVVLHRNTPSGVKRITR